MIGVIARLKIIPERQAEFELAFSRFQNTVRSAENGTVVFGLHKSRDVIGDYVVMEQYINDAALVLHQNTAHYKAIPETLGQFLAAPPEILVYDAIK